MPGGNGKKDPYYPFTKPWVAPPYEPFKYYGGHDEDVPIFINKDLTEIDLTPYLAPLTNNQDK